MKLNGEDMRGEPVELIARHNTQSEKSPYERLLGDAVRGDTALFTQDDSVEAAWRVVDPDPEERSAGRANTNQAHGARRPRRALSMAERPGMTRRSRRPRRAERAATVFLLDVDNTLLDNDRFTADLGDRLEHCFGAAQRARYWDIFAQRRAALGLAGLPGQLAGVSRRAR